MIHARKCPHCGNYTESEVQFDNSGPFYECEYCGAKSAIDPEFIKTDRENATIRTSPKDSSPMIGPRQALQPTGKAPGAEQTAALRKAVQALRDKTGCGMETAKAALRYKETHPGATAIGYVKALSCAVATRGLSFDQRVLRFSKREDQM